MEIASEYALFLLKFGTGLVGLLVLIAIARSSSKSNAGEIKVTNIGEKHQEYQTELYECMLSESDMKAYEKEKKKLVKAIENQSDRKNLFVLDFVGSVSAKEVESLREEITAVLSVAREGDEVLVKVDSGGGYVHSYGLAASQLDRLKGAGLQVTVSVDKIAASGGYMMACVADKIIAAPFAIVGSVGVVSEFPNFHKLLQKMNIDIEQHTAGEFKRTLTVLGENTDQGRDRFKEDLEKTHELFQNHVTHYRPSLVDVEFATGETWYGNVAVGKGLVDAVKTSDEFISSAVRDFNVLQVTYERKKKFSDRIASTSAMVVERVILKLAQISNGAKF
ncbi:protease SohB [Vibrio owensii]|uniref:protease SohB n=1 Tax=Vibrio owensii TaxID=696485 RepID=UPI0018F14CBE|nr:protease SohB [Vibrio owensii]